MMRILFDFRAVHFSRCLLSFKIEILNGLSMALNAPMVTDHGRLGWRDVRDVGRSDLLFTLFLEGENKFLRCRACAILCTIQHRLLTPHILQLFGGAGFFLDSGISLFDLRAYHLCGLHLNQTLTGTLFDLIIDEM